VAEPNTIAGSAGAGAASVGSGGVGSGGAGAVAVEARTDDTAAAAPTVIVDGLHIVYRVYGAGAAKGGAPAAFKRIIKRQRNPAIREVHAIKGLTFTAHRGESIGLIGRNGSGKSTLVRAIAGLLPPTKGAVYTDGQPTLLGVNAALMNDLTGEANITLGCLAMGLTPAQARERYTDIVEFAGLGEFIDLPMRTYSSGMSQRLRFAIAAVKSHDVLLIDEALATGDADFRRRSEQRIRELRDEAGTVFLVSHSLDAITQTCTRAIWLDKGTIKMDDTAETVVNAYNTYNQQQSAKK
jgi:teichoic acid transport system ATP-binding protein